MTREEALNILHNASVYHPDYLDALNMAIKALEQEPATKNDLRADYTINGLDDFIEFGKKAFGVELTTKNDLGFYKGKLALLELVEGTYADFCSCEGGEGWLKIDGKEYATDAGYAIEGVDIFMEVFKRRLAELPSVTPQEPQSFRWCTGCREYDQEKHCCHRWSKVIRDTVEEMKQEPKTGRWNDIPKYKDIAWQCSECERFTTMKHNYCPKCGAKMVEPQESEKNNGN